MNEQQLPGTGTEPKPETPQVPPHPRVNQSAPPTPQPVAPGQDVTSDQDYDDYVSNGKAYSAPRRRTLRTVLIVLLIVAIAAAAVYWFVVRKDDTPEKQTAADQTSRTQQPEADQDELIAAETKQYSATNFTVSFDYPEDWTVSEAPGSGKLTVRSPKLAMKNAAGKTVAGQVIFAIKDKNQAMTEFDGGNAVAGLDSQKISYTQPSAVQRGATYISFLDYTESGSALTGINGIYITGDTGYQKGQAIPKADFVAVDPIVSLTFELCEEGSCKAASQGSLSIGADAWNDERFKDPLLKLLQSLVII